MDDMELLSIAEKHFGGDVNIAKIYNTMIDVAKDNKISSDSISKICHGIYNKLRNGLIFKFKENIKEI